MKKFLSFAVIVLISSAAYAQQPPDQFKQKMLQAFDTLGIKSGRYYVLPANEGRIYPKYILIETDTTHYIGDTLALKVYNIVSDSAKLFDHISIIHNRPNGQPLISSYFMNNRLFTRKK